MQEVSICMESPVILPASAGAEQGRSVSAQTMTQFEEATTSGRMKEYCVRLVRFLLGNLASWAFKRALDSLI